MSEGLDLLSTTAFLGADGSIGADQTSSVFLILSERFADLESQWRNIGPVPAALEQTRSYALQGLGKYVDAATMAALGTTADDVDILEEAIVLTEEGTDLIADATAAIPSSC